MFKVDWLRIPIPFGADVSIISLLCVLAVKAASICKAFGVHFFSVEAMKLFGLDRDRCSPLVRQDRIALIEVDGVKHHQQAHAGSFEEPDQYLRHEHRVVNPRIPPASVRVILIEGKSSHIR